LPEPTRKFHFLKAIHIQADRHISAYDPRIDLTLFENAITESDGSPAKLYNPNLHLQCISITEWAAEVGFQMHGGQTDAVGVDDGMILNSKFSGKKLLHSHVKVVHKPGIVDNAGTIDVAEAYF
jgi:hypothetical protein